MKTAIYIEDGIVQLVITPESEFEKNALSSFEQKELDAKVFSGTFYDCRGGWIRQTEHYSSHMIHDESRDKSMIITLREDKEVKSNEQ